MATCKQNQHCDSETLDKTLLSHGIRPTSLRLLILKEMLHYNETFSLVDLETSLGTVDRSTIFRTLILFEEHHLLHAIEDGSGSTKYCICLHHDTCSLHNMHAHFHCVNCEKTFCIESEYIPLLQLEEGFTAQSINYTITGICPNCQHKRKK